MEEIMAVDSIQTWITALKGSLQEWEIADLNSPDKISDAFSRNISFGTGGIRGLMGVGPNRLNNLTIAKVAQGLANFLLNEERLQDPSVVIAYDTRIHSLEFAKITARVLAANGIKTSLFSEPQPTPLLSFAVRHLHCAAGVCITASHNPKEYNGFKVYGPTGDQVTDSLARNIQNQIERVDVFSDVNLVDYQDAISDGTIIALARDVVDCYFSSMIKELSTHDCSNLKLVYSPLNGAGASLAARVINYLSIDGTLVEEQVDPDGNFPTCPKPNPEDWSAMELGCRELVCNSADLFVATDPDADRIGVAVLEDGKPRLLSGNEVGLLLLDYFGRTFDCIDGVGQPVICSTIVSDPLAGKIAQKYGFELRKTLTGFKYIGEQIDLLEKIGNEASFLFGFEESCGYLKGTYARDKDGIEALALVCEMASHCKDRGESLVDRLNGIYSEFGYSVGAQISFTMEGIAGRSAMDSAMRRLRSGVIKTIGDFAIDSVVDYSLGAPMPIVNSTGLSSHNPQMLPPSDVLEFSLCNGGKVIIRPSGTEPKMKCYVFSSGETFEIATSLLNDIKGSLQICVGSLLNSVESQVTHLVLLSGGSGSRLWPLSNTARSKQFLKVLRDDEGRSVSMVQRVFRQISQVDGEFDVTIATSSNQTEMLSMQVPGQYALVAEPCRRDTAPAIMLACAHLYFEQGADRNDPVIVMPIDTYASQDYYNQLTTLSSLVNDCASDLVLMGVEPTYPSEKYGYILPDGQFRNNVARVASFKEKPAASIALEYIARDGLWNCGVFGFRLGYVLDVLSSYIAAESYRDVYEAYQLLPKTSFDYEVVESAASVSVLRYSGLWKDLGTWNTLTDEMHEFASGIVHMDDETCDNVHVINELSVPLVAAGIHDAVIVATHDGILVSGKEESAHIKDLVSRAACDSPMAQSSRWGDRAVLAPASSPSADSGMIEEFNINSDAVFSWSNVAKSASVFVVVSGAGSYSTRHGYIDYRAGDTISVSGTTRDIIFNSVDKTRIIRVCTEK